MKWERAFEELIILNVISRCIKDESDWEQSAWVYEWKIILVYLINFDDEMTGLVNVWRAVNDVYLDFSNAFEILL